METIRDDNNGNITILDEETIACKKSAAQSSPFETGDKVMVESEETLNIVRNNSLAKDIYCEKSASQICRNSEDARGDELRVNCVNAATTRDGISCEKLISQKILENAVNAVKNLFSPVKTHGMFSSAPVRTESVSAAGIGCRKLSYEDEKVVASNEAEKVESSQTEKASTCRNESDARGTMSEENGNAAAAAAARNSSNPLDTHNSTNDSYTTTVSRMDESFQSTVSDLDDFAQSDANKSNAETTVAENIFASETFMNETLNGNDNSLNDTLKRDNSTCSPGSENKDESIAGVASVRDEADDASTKPTECATESRISPESRNDVVNDDLPSQRTDGTVASPPLDNLISFEEDKNNLAEILSSSGVPVDRHSSTSNFFDRSFVDIVADKLNRLAIKTSDAIDDGEKYSTVAADADADAGETSETNRSSETDCSVLSGRSEDLFAERLSNHHNHHHHAKDLEKNFSTSTIILSKDEEDCVAFDDAPRYPLAQKTTATLIYDPSDCRSRRDGARDFGTSYTVLRDSVKDASEEQGGSHREERETAGQLEISFLSEVKSATPREYFASDADLDLLPVPIEHVYAPNGIEATSLADNAESRANDHRIPLASQKSYTFLHNPDPGLNRPVVRDGADSCVDKLDEIILGGGTFSEFNIIPYEKEDKVVTEVVTIKASTKEPEVFVSSTDLLRGANDGESVAERLRPKTESNAASPPPPPPPLQLGIPKMEDSDKGKRIEGSIAEEASPRADGAGSDAAAAAAAAKSSPPADNAVERQGKSNINVIIPSLEEDSSRWGRDGTEKALLKSVPEKRNLLAGNVVREKTPGGGEETETSESYASFGDRAKSGAGEKAKEEEEEEGGEALGGVVATDVFAKYNDTLACGDEAALCDNLRDDLARGQMMGGSDVELTELIQEQFTATDIEKICSVVCDIPELNLSKNIVMASQQFDRSFHDKSTSDACEAGFNANEHALLSSSCLDYLDSIKGKPSTRDYSRESIYIKFDPLVQSKTSADLNFPEGDKENVNVAVAAPGTKNVGASDQLIPITPLKPALNAANAPLSPLTASSQKNESKSVEKLNKLREMQSEIFRLREFYLQREERDKGKMNNYENEIAKLTGKVCLLEDRLKESEEREKSLVRKLNAQNESIDRLKKLLEEYLVHISRLTDQIEETRMESQKEIVALKDERDYYMGHLRGTEQAFSDVHSKYEKCKKALETLRKNEDAYRANIDELKLKVEQYSDAARDVREAASKEVANAYDKINDLKLCHTQEISRFRAQLRKTELKLQTVQEALEHKIKENQELAGICDELIEGKK